MSLLVMPFRVIEADFLNNWERFGMTNWINLDFPYIVSFLEPKTISCVLTEAYGQ